MRRLIQYLLFYPSMWIAGVLIVAFGFYVLVGWIGLAAYLWGWRGIGLGYSLSIALAVEPVAIASVALLSLAFRQRSAGR